MPTDELSIAIYELLQSSVDSLTVVMSVPSWSGGAATDAWSATQ